MNGCGECVRSSGVKLEVVEGWVGEVELEVTKMCNLEEEVLLCV